MKTTSTTEQNRARLLNLAAGGSGHTAPYIERVALDGAGDLDGGTGYIYHSPARKLPNGKTTQGEIFIGTFEHCKAFYMLPYMELPDDEKQRAADAMPVEDYGRHIAADVWRKYWEVMRTEDET